MGDTGFQKIILEHPISSKIFKISIKNFNFNSYKILIKYLL